MSNGPRTDEENDLLVADFFAMLTDDIAELRYCATERRRVLLTDRREGDVEFEGRRQNAAEANFGGKPTSGHRRSMITR